MKANQTPSGASGRLTAAAKVMGEAVVVGVLGAAFAFAANQVSPRGLDLARNYFPSGVARGVRPATAGGSLPAKGANYEQEAARLVAAQMKKEGLQVVDERQALEAFYGSRRQQSGIVFVDARDEEHYRQGHIPGAYEFDPYHPEKYFAAVLPVCQEAKQIVVYCHGGDCDDSESAALLLRDSGIPNQRLFVYTGGFTEWTASHLPVETGARDSGILVATNAPPITNAWSGSTPLLNTNP